jgi:hypothetical protein
LGGLFGKFGAVDGEQGGEVMEKPQKGDLVVQKDVNWGWGGRTVTPDNRIIWSSGGGEPMWNNCCVKDVYAQSITGSYNANYVIRDYFGENSAVVVDVFEEREKSLGLVTFKYDMMVLGLGEEKPIEAHSDKMRVIEKDWEWKSDLTPFGIAK